VHGLLETELVITRIVDTESQCAKALGGRQTPRDMRGGIVAIVGWR
jgi:hypothetical protein